MARLMLDARAVTLGGATNVGRDPGCALALSDRRASSLHARLAWTGAIWTVRDLGSTNGTFVDGVRLPPGVDRPLQAGARIAFGDPNLIWVLADHTPPLARAVNLENGSHINAVGSVLDVGCAAETAAHLVEVSERWTRVDGPEATAMHDGQIIVVEGQRWRLELPVVAAQTPLSATDDHGIALSIRVGDDEETLNLTVIGPDATSLIPRRTNHYLLLLLCRARLMDREAGFPELQAGWRDVDDICRELATDENRLNVEVHRLRKQLAPFGLPATVIERRPDTRSLRIGVARLVVIAGR
jgi:hypothetical protein